MAEDVLTRRVSVAGGQPVVCPYPFIDVNSTIQTIEVDDWAKIGCAVRLTSNYSIDIRAKCDYSYGNGMYVRASFQGEVDEYWRCLQLSRELLNSA